MPDQSESLHGIFITEAETESPFFGAGGRNYKMWNSGTISFLPCRGNQWALSTEKAKMDRQVPKAPKHLVPITAEPNPIPVL